MELGGNNCHFADIARACIYVGLDDKEYPDPAGSCYQSITQWENYILGNTQVPGESFYFHHHQTLNDIMDWDTIKGRNDFYLYIVGYAEFFNTSPGSDWCNDQTFGIVRHPKLSNALRSKINELVSNVNSKIAQSVKDMNNDHLNSSTPPRSTKITASVSQATLSPTSISLMMSGSGTSLRRLTTQTTRCL